MAQAIRDFAELKDFNEELTPKLSIATLCVSLRNIVLEFEAADEKIKEEKLIEYTDGLVRELKRTSLILAFSKQLAGYMPKYNELKHFNPNKIATAFI